MSKPLNLTLVCHWHPNGLLLAYATGGDYKRRHVIARVHLQYDPEEGRPTPQRVLRDATEALCVKMTFAE